jgi:hypothetical protein
MHIVNNVSNSLGSVLRLVGFANTKDVLSTAFKDATRSTWRTMQD